MTRPPERRASQPLDARGEVVAAVGRDGVSRPRSVAALRGVPFTVSVRDLGAVGDGRSHPLAERYRSLAAARADFPHAVELMDEIDWAATQGAINAARAAGGGTVVSPAGTYLCNRPLVFPECREFGERGEQVNWLGEGMYASVYRWPTDLGEGRFAVLCPRRYEGDGFYEGFWQDIGLEGPDPSPPLGATRARMHGWGWGARRRMVRCSARGFRAGLDIVGDHARFEDVVSRDCLYGVYFASASPHLYGDLVFEKCMFSGCTLATIAVHPDAQMTGCTMLGCYIGGAPYAILKEAGRGRDDTLLSGSNFVNCMFEFVGNAWLHDENSPRRAVVRQVTFDTCLFAWNDRERLAEGGRRRIAAWDFLRAERVRLLDPKEPRLLVPGEEALFKVEQTFGCEFHGHLHAVIDACQRARRPLLHRAARRDGGFRFCRVAQTGEWQARFQIVAEDEAGGVRRGDVLEWAGGAVRRSRARSPAPVAGICAMEAGPGEFTLAVTEGASLGVRCTVPRAEGLLVKGDDGAAAPAEGRPGEVPVGWSHYSADGQALIAVPLRG